MPNVSVRIQYELYERLKKEADKEGISVSDAIRNAIEASLSDVAPPVISADAAIWQEQLKQKDEQLRQKDEEITFLREEVTAARAAREEASSRSDTIVLQLTQQLDRANLMLEDLRYRRPWWRFWGKSSSER